MCLGDVPTSCLTYSVSMHVGNEGFTCIGTDYVIH